jgi:hypothetical protein
MKTRDKRQGTGVPQAAAADSQARPTALNEFMAYQVRFLVVSLLSFAVHSQLSADGSIQRCSSARESELKLLRRVL